LGALNLEEKQVKKVKIVTGSRVSQRVGDCSAIVNDQKMSKEETFQTTNPSGELVNSTESITTSGLAPLATCPGWTVFQFLGKRVLEEHWVEGTGYGDHIFIREREQLQSTVNVCWLWG